MIDIDDIEKRSVVTINSELAKFIKSDQEIIAKFCLEISFYKKLHTLFTEPELLDIVQSVFTNLTIRDFVLDLTDKLSIKLNLGHNGNLEIEKYLAGTLGYYKTSKDVDKDQQLIPIRVLSNICIFEDEILATLINNRWLVAIVIINLYFIESSFFDAEFSAPITQEKSLIRKSN